MSLNRRPGEPIDWREGTSSHVVTVQGQVADYDTLARTIQTIRDTTKIEYDPDLGRAPSSRRLVKSAGRTFDADL